MCYRNNIIFARAWSDHLGHKRIVFALLLFLTAISLIASTLFIERHLAYRREVTESTRTHLTSLTLRATREIDGIAREAADCANSLAERLSGGQLSHEEALRQLRELMERHPHFFTAALTYAPHALDPGRRLYSNLYVKRNGVIQQVRLDAIYDYTRPEHDWYGTAIKGAPHWSQPFYAKASQTLLVTYSVPFYDMAREPGRRTVKGVVTVAISMEEIGRIIESLDLGPTGFGALVSQKGIYLYHPDTELVVARKSLRDAARELNDKDRLLLAEKAETRSTGILDHRSMTTGLDAWLIYAPIPSTGWSLQNTFIKDDLPWDVGLMRRQLIRITVSLAIFFSSAVLLALRVYMGGRTRLWVVSSMISVLLATAIGFVWRVALSHDSLNRRDGIRISDKATLLHVMNTFTHESSVKHTEAPVFIPTGIYLESASLGASGDLSLTGYIWQKYHLGEQDKISRGFTISGASSLETGETCRIREYGCEVVRWHFRCVVPQHIDHSKYPLEQAKLSIQLLHRDLNHNVVLVPDLAAYKFMNPTSRPGLGKGLALPGWKLTRSFFELRKNVYNTNFGLERSLLKENFPALNFSIEIRRIFIHAFISNLTALIIVAVLLFTLLMMTTRDERLVGFMQAGSGRVLNICAAMFFVIAFSHVDVRRSIAAEQIFYLEYFYFLLYLTILLISLNSVMFSMGENIRLIQYKENLILKLLFWPFLLGLLFAITVAVFY